jgi:predicted dithiol-disulfide oxidoreductase (DUF899 family)
MTTHDIANPPVASRDEWLAARKRLLAEEKELTQHRDRVNAARRRLPMVKVEKDYVFDSPDGKRTLEELFEGRRQLIVYHFMFAPEWESGCMGCTGLVDEIGDLSHLAKRDTTYVLVSRAPQEKLDAMKARKGWSLPWYSSFGSDFNYDYHVTLDDAVTMPVYNYRDNDERTERGEPPLPNGEWHGLSVFFRTDDGIYHTYSTYARGCESLTDSYALLDVTPYGRQEDFEDSPAGWPQNPTYG